MALVLSLLAEFPASNCAILAAVIWLFLERNHCQSNNPFLLCCGNHVGIVHPGPLLMACSQIELPSSDLSICGLRSNNPEGVALDPVDVSVCRVPSESHAASRHARQPYENWTPVAARQASLETRERLYSNITFTTDDNGSSYGRLSDGTVLPNESIEYVTGGVRVHHLNGDSQVNGSFSFKTKKHSNMVRGWGLSASALGQLLAELDAREQHDLQTLHTQYALMEARLRAAIATHERAAAKPDTPQGVLHGPITRTEAEARLTAAGGHAGMFLVRSKADGAHVFSICHMTKRNAFHHILAEPTEEVVDGKTRQSYLFNSELLSGCSTVFEVIQHLEKLKQDKVCALLWNARCAQPLCFR
eukprot:m.913319 g.913319  ORF g.913319 m.913319 type:complete len:360 (+) comp23727_c0_seq52:3834-4913(+)